ncbi:hypothetical protein [Streptomyces sp. NPDC056628]|uniref:hypothetical protein n=1 Tax=Streptomyces sp. NPDC056628 TaxID=3345882 RepID=UPI00368013A9
MLRATWTTSTPGRRCALLGASAAVVCLGAVLASCGGGPGGEGFVATGPAGGPSHAPAAGPTGAVTLVPLPSGRASGAEGGPAGRRPGRGRVPSASVDQAAVGATTDARARATDGQGSVPSGTSGPATPSASAPAGSAPPVPTSPARLVVGDPVREPADRRWCEKVTLALHNAGGEAVRSGTVTFGSHVIGVLGVDWSTLESTHGLPVPIGAGTRTERTWTVCVDAWRVPLGMHVETRDVSVRWK